MRIAVVLYGQPRNYLKGYDNIINFIKRQHGCEFDFFYHCWTLNENETYKHATWRNIDKNELSFKKEIPAELHTLYNPVSYEIENQNNVTFDESLYINTLAFNNTKVELLYNINNILFQMYSRNKARNLLKTYLEKMGDTVHYDFIITLRFDISVMPQVLFHELNKSNVYISNISYPRKIIPDNCIIAPTNVFLQWFNIYDTIQELIDNKYLSEKIIKLNEILAINAEELVFAKYIYHYENTDNISYFQGGTI